MILITISLSCRSFLHLACCTCIYYWTCLHLWYHQESDRKWPSSLLFAHEKAGVRVIINRGTSVLHRCGLPLEKLVPVSSFARWNSLFPRTFLACVNIHCRLVNISYSSDLASKVRVIVSYCVVQCRIQFQEWLTRW